MRKPALLLAVLFASLLATASAAATPAGWDVVEAADCKAADDNLSWWVEPEGEGLRARRAHGWQRPALPFNLSLPDGYPFGRIQAIHEVEDGWLVGLNGGEWGGALVWVSKDGTQHAKVSDHQIVAFGRRGGLLYAIEGLSHLIIDHGSLISISKIGQQGWRAHRLRSFSGAPLALLVGKDDLYVLLRDRLVILNWLLAARELPLAAAGWKGSATSSMALDAGGKRLYLGLRHCVAEIDLVGAGMRWLRPPQ